VLLLAGSVQGARAEVARFLASFDDFRFLWASDSDAAYREFVKQSPSVEDYDKELSRFASVEAAIAGVRTTATIGALALHTGAAKAALCALSGAFKLAYTENLHRAAAAALSALTDAFRSTLSKLNRSPTDIASLKFLMDVQRDIRDTEAVIEARIAPIMDMYALLEQHLATDFMTKVEMDERAMLRVTWGKVVEKAGEVMKNIGGLQGGFRKRLLADIKAFKADSASFRDEYARSGPGVVGLAPPEAMERLRRYEDEFDILQRKRELYANGEALFALAPSAFVELDATAKELQLLGKLYSLYKDVMTRMDEWRNIFWADVVASGAAMAAEMESYAARCRKLPKKLRQWDAFAALSRKIDDAQKVLPLLQELSKPSLRPRHWEAVERITACALPVTDSEFKLSALLDAPLAARCDEILEVTDGADKELAIQRKLEGATEKWAAARFAFMPWKARGMSILAGAGAVLEELDEGQMNLQTLLTMRNVGVFRAAVQAQLTTLCDTAETLELWSKVQMMWCSLESVFLGGDIAKQMPAVAKRFQKIDKDFANIMGRAVDTARVVDVCANEILRMSLPAMFEELEKCQKNLESYLEQKRNKFPRFYFVSNPVLLQIL
jgi:dynein heavy chain